MTVHNIGNPGIPEKAVRNHEQLSSPAQQTGSAEETKRTENSREDDVRISGKTFPGEVDFAKNILSKLDEKQIHNLKQVKQNIDKGFYDSAAVQQSVSRSIETQLHSLEASILSTGQGTSQERLPSLTPEKIQHLTQNQEVTESVSRKILNDLRKLL